MKTEIKTRVIEYLSDKTDPEAVEIFKLLTPKRGRPVGWRKTTSSTVVTDTESVVNT